MRAHWFGGLILLGALTSCETPIEPLRPDAAARDGGRETLYGCPVYRRRLGSPGDTPAGDTYDAFARPLFEEICIRCHSSTLVEPEDRTNAPAGFNWDDEASVRAHLEEIREAVGVTNFMDPDLNITCDERRRLVRWVDIGAP